jgi:hypothetical protein
MAKRKDLPVGMGTQTEAMIEELGFHFRLNTHELIRKMIRDIDEPGINKEFLEYNQRHKIRRIEKSNRIRGFKFKEDEIEEFIKKQWQCRIKGLSTFIKQLVYFNYEKHVEEIKPAED